ncbi:hypothetical protein CDAR_6871 [Caerostris darwini]|uniref:Uncharacterized protein n=1 Tax=Caerostris darwini TaxID=1538125 RepID=A0AAV4SAD3_9ARAC|nr:hypothetical protein CDAR_6871 [Caerostris darwini]
MALQLGQSCANRSNFTIKRSTSCNRDVEKKKKFEKNPGPGVRAIRQRDPSVKILSHSGSGTFKEIPCALNGNNGFN